MESESFKPIHDDFYPCSCMRRKPGRRHAEEVLLPWITWRLKQRKQNSTRLDGAMMVPKLREVSGKGGKRGCVRWMAWGEISGLPDWS